MILLKQQIIFAIFVFLCHIAFGERWSRQLSLNKPIVNDWMPITQNVKNEKTSTFNDDLTSAAQTQFQFFTEPLNNRFSLQQSHLAHPSAAPSEINSFIQNSPPQFQFLNTGAQQQKQRTVQTFGGPITNKPIAEPLIQSQPHFQFMQEIQRTPQVHHYQSQPIPKTHQTFTQHVPSFQNIAQQPEQHRVPHFQKHPTPPELQSIAQNQQQQFLQETDQPSQLLYVPFNQVLPQNHQQTALFGDNLVQNRFNILNQPPSASLINDFYSQNDVNGLTKKPITTTTRRPTIVPVTTSFKLTTPFETTSKLKPHQPPLSMFVANDKFKGKATESDVLSTLKNSNSIDVMDQVNANAPKVFIGPSGMSAPDGYSKFELPYLSSIDGNRNERKIDQLPFFVAPLSYKTPPGFSKIPLPAPHVGSVVVNQPNSIENNESNGFTQDSYYTKQPHLISTNLNNINHSNNNNNNNNNQNIPKKNTQTVKLSSGFHLGSNGNVQLFSNEFTFPTLSPSTTQHQSKIFPNTTPRPSFSASTPLTKVKASLVQEQYSTFVPTTTHTPTKYQEFDSTRSDYFTSVTSGPSTSRLSASSSFEYDFESKLQKPKKDFNFKPIPDFNFETTKKARAKTSTTASPTTKTVIIDNNRHKSIDHTFLSSTPVPPTFDYTPTVSIIENTDTFRQTPLFTDISSRSTPRPSQQNYLVDIDELNRHKYNGDGHETQFNTEDQTIKNHDFFLQGDNNPATESPQYNLPSELPPISAQLPGLINSLMDDKWMQVNNITDEDLTTTARTTTTTTTKRPVPNRGRRPTAASTSRTMSFTTEQNYERKQVTIGRRPSTYSSRASISATEPTYTSRTTPARSSKIRYNITSEDQSRFRTRNRRPLHNTEEDNIEYQRDILNQNYPSSVRPPIDYPTLSTERIVESVHIHPEALNVEEQIVSDYNAPVDVIPLSGNQQFNNEHPLYTPDNPLYYENTIDTTTTTTTTTTSFPQTTLTQFKYIKSQKNSSKEQEIVIPQHKTVSHRLKGNFNFNRNIDSFYNAKTHDTTQATDIDKEHHVEEVISSLDPSVSTITSTTTEAPETEAPATRRTNFPRRRLYTTTTEPSTDNTESYTSRNKARKENVVVVKKVRNRGRTTTTEAPETTRRSTVVRSRTSYTSRNVNRETNEYNKEANKPRFRIRENTQQRFKLDAQESQWSSRFNQNSFQPIDGKSKSIHSHEVDDNQEIVTANPNAENEQYLVNVSASVIPENPSENEDETLNMVSTTKRDDLAQGQKPEFDTEKTDEIEKDTKTEKKSTKLEKKNQRRGVWRRKTVRPVDGFETAETQNIGKHLYNAVSDNSDKVEKEKNINIEELLTTLSPKVTEVETTTTVLPEQTIIEDSKTRMFDDARKAFAEFLSTEDDGDDAVNMEEADDKLEKDSTTSTQVPTTDEPATTTTTTLLQTTPMAGEVEALTSKVKKEKNQIKTSTSQKVTGEICFRGKCIKTSEK